MTIITKPSNDKKNNEKLVLPLFGAVGIPTDATAPAPSMNGDDNESLVVQPTRRRSSSATTIFLFLSALAVMCMGILGGVAIYRLYAPSQMERMRFHGFCGVPYDSQAISNTEMLQFNNNYRHDPHSVDVDNLEAFRSLASKMELNDLSNDFFREEFDLDWGDDKSYAKIEVPEFKDGRRGRFIHDFKANQSGIIDTLAGRCFIMPLDRETVLPPQNLYDLLLKMWNGYYNIDTERLKKNMRIVTPEITDLSLISPVIGNECDGQKVYLLEKYVSGVFKRDIESISDQGKFAEFSGHCIVEYDFINIAEIEKMEKAQKK